MIEYCKLLLLLLGRSSPSILVPFLQPFLPRSLRLFLIPSLHISPFHSFLPTPSIPPSTLPALHSYPSLLILSYLPPPILSPFLLSCLFHRASLPPPTPFFPGRSLSSRLGYNLFNSRHGSIFYPIHGMPVPNSPQSS